ncbi:MAG TPA: LysM peptidoglycan-binding domain-containing protein, partial [Candidatus Kapabacteria bacterium]|nr:LysM peptidoglycan-binding domain-containing protein [Candidatus Kapabacteria bacterium]
MARNQTVHFLIVLCLGVSLSACETSRYQPTRNVYRSADHAAQGFHTVRPGETLYSIASRNRRNPDELARANGIKPPYQIYPGQIIYFNKTASAPVSRSKPAAKPPATNQTSRYKKPASNTKPIQEKVANQRDKKVDISWKWPAGGPVIETFSTAGQVNKGIDL